MKRKIIKQGYNTLTMTLPSDWVRKLNLKAGDEVNVLENSGILNIYGKQNDELKSTTIHINGLTVPMLWRFFQSAYREGYDEIKICFDPNKKYESAYNYYASQVEWKKMGEKTSSKYGLDLINEIVNRFIGLAIIDHGEDYCVIREMGDASSKEFDNSLRRIFLLLNELFDTVIDLIKKNKVGDIGVCKQLHTMDINVDRFIDYCCRINNKINDSTFQKNKQAMFSSLFLLELLGDEFKYVGMHLAKSKKNVDEILPFVEKVKEHFEMYYKLFYKFDPDGVGAFGNNDSKIYNDHFHWKEATNKDVNSIRRHFMKISKFIFCLMELRIEMEY